MLSSLPPAVWGPPLWAALHAITFAYPDSPSQEDADALYALFAALRGNLPCAWCAKHYAAELGDGSALRAALASRNLLTRWLVDVHNRVNARLGKAEVPYEVVMRNFESAALSCTQCGVGGGGDAARAVAGGGSHHALPPWWPPPPPPLPTTTASGVSSMQQPPRWRQQDPPMNVVVLGTAGCLVVLLLLVGLVAVVAARGRRHPAAAPRT